MSTNNKFLSHSSSLICDSHHYRPLISTFVYSLNIVSIRIENLSQVNEASSNNILSIEKNIKANTNLTIKNSSMDFNQLNNMSDIYQNCRNVSLE